MSKVSEYRHARTNKEGGKGRGKVAGWLTGWLAYLPEHHDWGDIERVGTRSRVDLEGLGEELRVCSGDEFVDRVGRLVVRVALLRLGLGSSHSVV